MGVIGVDLVDADLVASRGAVGLVKSGKIINANTQQYALAA
jgi:hypothetical protein